MDEVEYKLKTGNNVLVVNAVEKLIRTIKSKFKPTERQKFVLENEELKFLREKCSAKDTLVSLTACQGLLGLVESGVLEISHTMSTVITLLPTAHNFSAIVSTMSGLLVLDLKFRLIPGKEYKCPFSFKSPQHPFITVLEKNEEATQDVLNQMHALCTHPDYTISSNSLELLRPVFLWLVCRPQGVHLPAWRLLLSLTEHSGQSDMLLDCLTWQQSNEPKQVESVLQIYSMCAESAGPAARDLAVCLPPLLVRLSHYMLVHGHDPRPCYTVINKCFASDAAELSELAPLSLALLADNLTVTSASHLHELFTLALTIINKYEIPRVYLGVFVAQTLQWLHLPSSLTHTALKIATKIIDLYQNEARNDCDNKMKGLQKNEILQTLIHSDYRLAIYYKLFTCWERFKDNPDKLKSWFEGIGTVDKHFQLDLSSFLFGVLCEKATKEVMEDIVLKSLKILVGLIDVRKYLAVSLLAVLVYKVADEMSPAVRLECLKAVPKMAKIKENIPTVVSYLNKLKANNGAPTSLLIHLYLTLTEVQVRCFPYLHELLVDMTTKPDELKWENDVARAMACKKICQIRPSSGVELVPVLSSILNRCTDEAGGLASACALQCILELWKHRAVSPVSTWTALSQRLMKETRTDVLVSVCQLLSEITSLYVQTPEYDKLLESSASFLWQLVGESCAETSGAAASALACYNINQYSLKAVPEVYRKTVKLPPSHCKTPADAARKPEDVLDYIPCEIWPEVYKYAAPYCLPGIERFTSTLIERELRQFRSGVYTSDARTEPSNLTYLLPSSVIRGLGDFLRRQATSPTYDCPTSSLLSILTSLSHDYSRPLPPLDLSFLHDLYHRGNIWRKPCLLLAARQSHTSASAKRMVTNYLAGLEVGKIEDTEIVTLFEILPPLCRNLPPNSIRSPIEKSLSYAFDKIRNTKVRKHISIDRSQENVTNRKDDSKSQEIDGKIDDCSNEDDEPLFIRLLNLIGECLSCDKIHEANRTLLSQIVECYFDEISEDNVAWPAYVSLSPLLPLPSVSRLTSPSLRWGTGGEELRKCGEIRAKLAGGGDLTYLEEIVDAAKDCPSEHQSILSILAGPLKQCACAASTPATCAAGCAWLLPLMARTQTLLNESTDESAKAYLCDVWALSVLCLSGVWTLHDKMAAGAWPEDKMAAGAWPLHDNLAGIGVVGLLSREAWQDHITQVLGWLWHESSRRALPVACVVASRAARLLPSYPRGVCPTVGMLTFS